MKSENRSGQPQRRGSIFPRRLRDGRVSPRAWQEARAAARHSRREILVLVPLIAGVLVVYTQRESVAPGFERYVRYGTVIALLVLGWALARVLGRAFGPQLVGNYWSDWWIWYVGPLIGAGIAALAYEYLYLRPLRPVPVGPPETGVEEPRPGDAAVS